MKAFKTIKQEIKKNFSNIEAMQAEIKKLDFSEEKHEAAQRCRFNSPELSALYEKAGRSYLVEIYNINTTASSYKIFHTQEGAIKAYTTVVTWLLQSMYSDEQRRKMLSEMHD